MTAKQYQDLMLPKLRGRLDGLEVINEWSAFRGVYGQYSPRVDIAVGPFSTITDQTLINEYNRILKQEELIMFLRKVFDFHLINTQQSLLETEKIYHINSKIRKNKNARCFMAIEIENTSTKKHIMGSMVNACSLGRIGIGVAFNDSVVRTFNRIVRYLSFLERVGKTSYDTTNFFIITKEQFQELLEQN
tara:strand:- start:88 stop:657 length:570 start_codon:yes stop_codon:yes gene_type:complete